MGYRNKRKTITDSEFNAQKEAKTEIANSFKCSDCSVYKQDCRNCKLNRKNAMYATFLAKAVKTLKPWEETLEPGDIRRLAIKYKLHDLGDTIYSLMLTTHLFKPRARKALELKRDLSTFFTSIQHLLDKQDTDSIVSFGISQHQAHDTSSQSQQQDSARRSSASITYAHVLRASGRRNGQDSPANPSTPTTHTHTQTHTHTHTHTGTPIRPPPQYLPCLNRPHLGRQPLSQPQTRPHNTPRMPYVTKR